MNLSVKTLLLSAFVGALTATASNAQSISDCDSALVRSTYNRTERQFVDWRLAERVDESTYNQIKQEAGGNAVIYGVSVGANWGKFQENIASRKSSRDASLTSDFFRNVAWTGLDPNAVTAYSSCLQTVVATRKALAMLPRTATASDVSFELMYTVVGTSPNPLQVTWSGAEAATGALPKEIYGGSHTVVIRRPSIQSTLAVNGSGLSDAVVLTPFPPLPPPTPPVPPSPLQAAHSLQSAQQGASPTTLQCPGNLKALSCSAIRTPDGINICVGKISSDGTRCSFDCAAPPPPQYWQTRLTCGDVTEIATKQVEVSSSNSWTAECSGGLHATQCIGNVGSGPLVTQLCEAKLNATGTGCTAVNCGKPATMHMVCAAVDTSSKMQDGTGGIMLCDDPTAKPSFCLNYTGNGQRFCRAQFVDAVSGGGSADAAGQTVRDARGCTFTQCNAQPSGWHKFMICMKRRQ